MFSKFRIAIVVSHPIQHFCPQYVSFAKNNDIVFKVFFASTLGYKKYIDLSFKQEISWGNLHLDKFDHCFLNGEAVIQSDKNLDAVSVEQELDNYNPDVVIIYGYWQKFQRRVHMWVARRAIKLAYISDSELRQRRGFIKRLLKEMFIKKYFSKIDLFLSVGDANEEYYGSYGVKKEKILRMHLPIDIYQYDEAYKNRDCTRKQIRDKYSISETDNVAIVVGKLVSWKNQSHIIDAMRLLESAGIIMHLFIIGSGEMLDTLNQQATVLKESKVYFTGFINVDELPAYYSAADIYIHPASVEPHSVAVSEAIYMGCPIIISDRCGSYGANDDVQENQNGFIYPFGDIEALAGKIKTLIADDNMKKNFSQHSHNISRRFQECAHVSVIRKIKDRLQEG